MLAQVLGAMCAAGVVYANYKSAIDVFEGGADIRTVGTNTSSAGIFCTYPAEFMTKTGQFFSEFIASTILMFLIYALKDDGNLGAGNLTPLGLFFIIFGIGACFGWETGYAINLARDFGPRLMSYFLGYGHEVWSAGGYYFWVGFPGVPHSGALLTSSAGTNGCTFLRLFVRWLAVRRLLVHRREPNQYTLDGPQAFHSATT